MLKLHCCIFYNEKVGLYILYNSFLKEEREERDGTTTVTPDLVLALKRKGKDWFRNDC